MVVLDVTIVAVALPALQEDLGFSTESLQWVVTSYTLVFGGFLLVAGRAGDLLGRRRIFSLGLGVFAAASLACGLAWSPAALVAFRAVQGLGAALVAPSALALLTAAFAGPRERQRAIAGWTAAAAGGGASGWVLGGLLTDAVGWEAVFLVNVPVGTAGVLLAARLLDETRADSGRAPVDVAGAVTVTAGLALLVYGLTTAQHAGFDSPGVVSSLLASGLLLPAFVLVERRVSRP